MPRSVEPLSVAGKMKSRMGARVWADDDGGKAIVPWQPRRTLVSNLTRMLSSQNQLSASHRKQGGTRTALLSASSKLFFDPHFRV
jgi:hypothetical protein